MNHKHESHGVIATRWFMHSSLSEFTSTGAYLTDKSYQGHYRSPSDKLYLPTFDRCNNCPRLKVLRPNFYLESQVTVCNFILFQVMWHCARRMFKTFESRASLSNAGRTMCAINLLNELCRWCSRAFSGEQPGQMLWISVNSGLLVALLGERSHLEGLSNETNS